MANSMERAKSSPNKTRSKKEHGKTANLLALSNLPAQTKIRSDIYILFISNLNYYNILQKITNFTKKKI